MEYYSILLFPVRNLGTKMSQEVGTAFLGNLELFMKIVKKGEFIMTANLGTCFMFSI